MKVLLRVIDFYDGQEYGLEEQYTTEQLDQMLPFHLLDRVNELARFIQFDIDRVRRREKAYDEGSERANDQ
jgi:hypothetical protein